MKSGSFFVRCDRAEPLRRPEGHSYPRRGRDDGSDTFELRVLVTGGAAGIGNATARSSLAPGRGGHLLCRCARSSRSQISSDE
jgi:hypothetical protein